MVDYDKPSTAFIRRMTSKPLVEIRGGIKPLKWSNYNIVSRKQLTKVKGSCTAIAYVMYAYAKEQGRIRGIIRPFNDVHLRFSTERGIA